MGDDQIHSSCSSRLNPPTAGTSASTSDSMRREDNPFSFKHFLRNDGSNYQNKGARPKVYFDGRPIASISDVDLPPRPSTYDEKTTKNPTRIMPESSSALPDFVQDHLVVEQCYLGHSGSENDFNFDMNLPDFTPSRDSINVNRIKLDTSQNARKCDGNSEENNLSIPLDLPARPQVGFPLDLPEVGLSNGPSRNCTSGEVGVSKSLPDFLADSAVCAQKEPSLNSLESPERENDRLRRDLEMTRRQLNEKMMRCEYLERELEVSKNKEHEFTRQLSKALKQFEMNLEKSKSRTVCAEETIAKLKQELKTLGSQMEDLKLENRTLRGDEGAVGGHDYYNNVNSRRLAQELRVAANTAEHSLRQLLNGVDNLRLMASTLEDIQRLGGTKETFVDIEENSSGPAL